MRFDTTSMRRRHTTAALVGAAALSIGALAAGPGAGAATCTPATPEECSLRELATAVGLRMGATAEPPDTVPGPYATTLAGEFNAVTPENALKWYTVRPTQGVWQFGPGDAVVDFAVAHDLEVRGHTLVWAQDTYTPAWVRAITDRAALQAEVDDQIRTVMARYRDRVHRWDVVNEPLASVGTGRSTSVFWDVLGDGWVGDAFRVAHATDPDAELWLNEYGTDWVPGKHEALLSLVTDLVDDGVPIDGVGLQVHRLSVDGPDVATFEAQLRDFTALGLDVAITELDVPTNPTDPDAFADQAAAYRRIVGACLAVDGCEEVTTWGVTDASTWLDSLGLFPTPTRPLLFDAQFRPKPAYDAVHALLAARLQSSSTTTTAPVPSSTTSSTVAPTTAVATATATATPRFTG